MTRLLYKVTIWLLQQCHMLHYFPTKWSCPIMGVHCDKSAPLRPPSPGHIVLGAPHTGRSSYRHGPHAPRPGLCNPATFPPSLTITGRSHQLVQQSSHLGLSRHYDPLLLARGTSQRPHRPLFSRQPAQQSDAKGLWEDGRSGSSASRPCRVPGGEADGGGTASWFTTMCHTVIVPIECNGGVTPPNTGVCETTISPPHTF